MTNRELAHVVKDQKPLVLTADKLAGQACELMWERGTGSTLIVDDNARLIGIFTGRDTVRILADKDEVATRPLTEVMTCNPVSVSPKSSVIDALRAMKVGGFRHVPVTEDGKVVGIVSRGDFKGMELEAFERYATGIPSSRGNYRDLQQMIANQQPLLLAADRTVQDACRAMMREKAGSVLVLNDAKQLSGIFTGRDAVHLLAGAKNAAATALAEAMTPSPFTISPSGNAIEALRTMNAQGFRHLPVVNDGIVVGIVSRNDFTGIELDRLEEEEHLAECIW